MSLDGVIVHKLISTDFAVVETLATGTLNILSGGYEIDFPPTIPSSTDVSLLVEKIENNVIQLEWSLAASDSTTITSGNGNEIELSAPDSLNQSYHLIFMDYDDNENYTNKVLAVGNDDQKGNINLKLENYNLVANPVINMSNGYKFKLTSQPMYTDDVDFFMPGYSVNAPVTGKALVVDSTNDLSLKHIAVHFAFDSINNSPIYTSSDNKTVSLLDPLSASVSMVNLEFPRIYPTIDYKNKVLSVQVDDGVGGVRLEFQSEFLLVDSLRMGPTTIVRNSAVTGSQNTMTLPPKLTSESNQIGKIMSVSAATANSYSLEFAETGRLFSANGKKLTLGVTQNQIECGLNFPRYAPNVLNQHIAVQSDSNVSNRTISLEYSKVINVFDNQAGNETRTTIKSNLNTVDHTIFLPSLSTASVQAQVMAVSAKDATSEELEYQNPWSIPNASGSRTTVQVSLSANDSCVLTLPAIDKTQSPNHYQDRVLRVASVNIDQIELAFETLDSFTGIAQTELRNVNSFGTNLKSAVTQASHSLTLPDAVGAEVSDLVFLKSISTVSGIVLTTGFDRPGILRASTTGKKLEIKAQPNLSSNTQIQLPLDKTNAAIGNTLVGDSNGVLVFDFPKSLQLPASNGNTIDLTTKNMNQSILYQLPKTDRLPLNLYQAELVTVSSQEHSVDETIFQLEYSPAMKLHSQVQAGETLVKSDRFSQLLPNALATINTRIELPSTPRTGYLVVSAQSDHETAGDQAAVELKFQPTALPILADSTQTNTITLDGADSFDDDHVIALPVFSSELSASRGKMVRSLNVTGNIYHVRAVATAPLSSSVYSSFSSVIGTGHQITCPMQTIDGLALSVGDRVLVAGQTNGSENGLYKVTNVTGSILMIRDENFDTPEKLSSLGTILATGGLTYLGKTFVLVDLFARKMQGTISNASTTLTGTNTKFSEEISVGSVVEFEDGEKVVVLSVSSDTSATLSLAPNIDRNLERLRSSVRLGIDSLRFIQIQGDVSKEHVRLHAHHIAATPELVIGSGDTTSIVSNSSDRIVHAEFSEIEPSPHTEFLCFTAVDGAESNRDLRRVSLGGSSGKKFARFKSLQSVVTLPEEGIDFESLTVSMINRNLALVFDAVEHSVEACFSVVDQPFGQGVANRGYGLQCLRSGFYTFLMNLKVRANTSSAVLTPANNFIEIKLMKGNGLADEDGTCENRVADIEIFRRNEMVTKQLTFEAQLVKNEIYYFLFKHSETNTSLANGLLDVDSKTSLLIKLH